MEKFIPVLKLFMEKLTLGLALLAAKKEGEEDARQDSVEETLEDVVKADKQKENKALRDIVADKYDRSKLRDPSSNGEG